MITTNHFIKHTIYQYHSPFIQVICACVTASHAHCVVTTNRCGNCQHHSNYKCSSSNSVQVKSKLRKDLFWTQSTFESPSFSDFKLELKPKLESTHLYFRLKTNQPDNPLPVVDLYNCRTTGQLQINHSLQANYRSTTVYRPISGQQQANSSRQIINSRFVAFSS